MTEYPQYPTDGNNPYGGSTAEGAPATPGVRPASVSLAVKLIWANIALGIISAIVTFTMLDSIVDEQLEAAGATDAMTADAARTGAVIGVVFGLVVSVALYTLVAIFISKGKNWARIVYAVLAALSILGGVFGLTGQPALLLILTVVSLVLTVVAVVMLFRADANAWFKARKA